MFLCVQSSIEVSRIERSIVNYFSNIPSYDLTNIPPPPKDPFEIFKSDFYEKIFFVKSTNEKCKLLMTFLLPPVNRERKYLEYLASLIQYEGAGSLSDYFIDEALALKVKARVGCQNFEGNSFFTLFTIDVNLTTKGFEDFDLVLEAIFAYLLLLKSTKIEDHEMRYKEFKEIKEILFKYKKEKLAIQNVQELAVNMKFFDDKDILIGNRLNLVVIF
jgi:secreted Zn-dependent insulinase-like peptidase